MNLNYIVLSRCEYKREFFLFRLRSKVISAFGILYLFMIYDIRWSDTIIYAAGLRQNHPRGDLTSDATYIRVI